MRLRSCLAFAVTAAVAAACASAPHHTDADPSTATRGARTNALLAPSTLPFGAPPFDRIRDADYEPAIDEGMRQHLAEVRQIANQSAPATFDNTIVPMERSGDLLTRAANTFFAVVQANSDSTLERIQTEEAPRLAAHNDEIYLDAKLFGRIQSLYDRRDALGLDPEQKNLVARYYEDFVRAGAKLSEADKTRLRALNQEESKLSTGFQNRLLAATKRGALVLDDRAQLDGLSEGEIAAAADAAKQRGLAGKWVIPLQNTTQQPAQASLRNRDVRAHLFTASTQRAEHGDTSDTRSVIQRLAAERAERARLLGYPTYAAYALENQMAKTPDAAIRLLTDLVPAANARAAREAADMQALINQQNGGFTLGPQDWQYYAEQVRKAKYALDESQIKPYFELDRVLHDGVFFAANQLYGLTFRERKDIPVYEPSVRVFEVFDKDGTSLALFYCDYFKRDNKSGGAWENALVSQSKLLGRKAVVYNVANLPQPAPGQPALLSFNDVTTMFHEFGHALHDIFSNVEYPTFAGTNVPRDFVEFPSQFNEHWALDPVVFAHYARHYQTGQPMPRELVDKIKATRTFNQGYATTESLAAMLLDMAWHTLPAGTPLQPVDSFETASLTRFNINNPLIPPRYRSSYFAHIWDNGYAAGYYAYLWSEVLDDDAYAWFLEHGGLTRANGQRFRDMILSRGHTEDVGALYRAFRGRDPNVNALLQERGLTPAPARP